MSLWSDEAKAAAWKIGKWIIGAIIVLAGLYFALKAGLPQ